MTIHRAYISDKPVEFVALHDAAKAGFRTGFLLTSEADMKIEDVVRELQQPKSPLGVVYISENPDSAWRRFASLFTLSVAAGGVVEDEQGRILSIYRRGHWDLPKGKLDYDELPAEAAVREVKEETGINQLILGQELATTFHSYLEKGRTMLKKTHWYRMSSTSGQALVPQHDEDIEKVEWMSREMVREKFYSNTYQSIRDLLDLYFSS